MTPDESIAQRAAARLVGAQIVQMAVVPDCETAYPKLIVLTNDGRLFSTHNSKDDTFGTDWVAIPLPPSLIAP